MALPKGMRVIALTVLGVLVVQLGPSPHTAQTVTLALMGDVMLGRGVARAHCPGIEAQPLAQSVLNCPNENWQTALAAMASEISVADLALANLESPLSHAPLQSEAYDLRADPGSAAALTGAGVDLLSLANNHAMDSGAAGLQDTHLALQSAGLEGIEAASGPLYRSVNGLRLAFLAFNDVDVLMDLEAATGLVRQAHSDGALVVISLHWGLEYRPAPSARQQAIAQALADAGASLIWGHHPHVLQPVVWLQGRGQPAPAVVAYSLGNALFDQAALPETQRSAVLLVSLGPQGVRSLQAIPFGIDAFKGQVRPATPAERMAVFDRLKLAAP